jgi:hypothetical protein
MAFPLLAPLVFSAAVPVGLEPVDGKWTLTRDSAPHFVKGAGVDRSYPNIQPHVKNLGGNSIRTWEEGEWDDALSYVEPEGLTACLGIRVDPSQMAESRQSYIEDLINRYKDRAGVLIWVVSNEIETQDPNLWPFRFGLINTIAGYVKGRDSDHP